MKTIESDMRIVNVRVGDDRDKWRGRTGVADPESLGERRRRRRIMTAIS